mmetsp:Transcript_43415/g.94283  ORF Transcript_43415/g.94283 Transcript_43415/m.94283 type:complete len:374 (-) Transcript_43415:107-1228(-)
MRMFNCHWPETWVYPTIDWDLLSVDPERVAHIIQSALSTAFAADDGRTWGVRRNLSTSRSFHIFSPGGKHGPVTNLVDITYDKDLRLESTSEHPLVVEAGDVSKALFVRLDHGLRHLKASYQSAAHRNERDKIVLSRLLVTRRIGVGSQELARLSEREILDGLPAHVSSEILSKSGFRRRREVGVQANWLAEAAHCASQTDDGVTDPVLARFSDLEHKLADKDEQILALRAKHEGALQQLRRAMKHERGTKAPEPTPEGTPYRRRRRPDSQTTPPLSGRETPSTNTKRPLNLSLTPAMSTERATTHHLSLDDADLSDDNELPWQRSERGKRDAAYPWTPTHSHASGVLQIILFFPVLLTLHGFAAVAVFLLRS